MYGSMCAHAFLYYNVDLTYLLYYTHFSTLSVLTSHCNWEIIEGPFKVTYARHTRLPTHGTGPWDGVVHGAPHTPRPTPQPLSRPNCEDPRGGRSILCCDDFQLYMRLRHSRHPGVTQTDQGLNLRSGGATAQVRVHIPQRALPLAIRSRPPGCQMEKAGESLAKDIPA